MQVHTINYNIMIFTNSLIPNNLYMQIYILYTIKYKDLDFTNCFKKNWKEKKRLENCTFYSRKYKKKEDKKKELTKGIKVIEVWEIIAGVIPLSHVAGHLREYSV